MKHIPHNVEKGHTESQNHETHPSQCREGSHGKPKP